MKQIELTKGAIALVDDEDFEKVSKYKWCVNAQGYAVRGFQVNGAKYQIRMHRFILGDSCAGLEVDHINGNRTDNRKANLRTATRRENACNVAKRPLADGTSIFKGVRKAKGRKKWTARICYKGKDLHLGQFNSEIEAAKAYNEAAKRLNGEYARLNTI